MLLILMYHRVSQTGQPNDVAAFTEHLQRLVDNFTIVLPGDPLPKRQLSICLTFDDAYFDFYHYVYPLLQQLNTKALLAVPVQYINDDTVCSARTRLDVPYEKAMDPEIYPAAAPFCTWPELRDMAASNHVMMASHAYQHPDLTRDDIDLNLELEAAQQILQNKLNQTINTLVYPYGKMNRQLHRKVRQHYEYDMRIGSALNTGWDNNNGLLYRVDANKFWMAQKHLSKTDLFKYTLKYFNNRLRCI